MLTNRDFELNDAELEQLNDWATEIAKAMCAAEQESWTINVTFSFSNYGNTVAASVGCNHCHQIILRDD